MTWIPERAELVGEEPALATYERPDLFTSILSGVGGGFVLGMMIGAVGVDRMGTASHTGLMTFFAVWAITAVLFPLIAQVYSRVHAAELRKAADVWHEAKPWLEVETKMALHAIGEAKSQGVDNSTLHTLLASLIAVNAGAPEDPATLTEEQQSAAGEMCRRVEREASAAVERELYVTEERRALEASLAQEHETARLAKERSAFEGQLAVAEDLLSNLPAPLELGHNER